MKSIFSFFPFASKPPSATELLRRYAEGDLSSDERKTVEKQLQASESLQREYGSIQKTVTALKSLSRPIPSEDVWRNILRELKTVQPEPVWFPWWYKHPFWVKTFGIACCVLVVFVIGIYQTHWDSSYRLVVIQDGNGFQEEAESYLVHHDFSGIPPFTREGLVAFYTLRPAGTHE